MISTPGPNSNISRPVPNKSRLQSDDQLAKIAADAVAKTWAMATSNEIKWNIEAQRGDITVWSIVQGSHKILMSDGEVGASPSVLFHLLHKNIQSHTKWNPMLTRYVFFGGVWLFGPVDARDTCVGLCVVA